jgi:hypothetical protein
MGKLNWKSQADIEIEQSNESKQKEIEALKQQLADTDFYFIRQLDTGVPIPTEVKNQRKLTRQRLNELGL